MSSRPPWPWPHPDPDDGQAAWDDYMATHPEPPVGDEDDDG